MTTGLQARLEQALRERDEARAQGAALFEAIERAARGESFKATLRNPGAALLREVVALRRVRDQLRDDVSVGRINLVDECRELSEACREADKARGGA